MKRRLPMDSWAFRTEFVEHVRKWLSDGDTPRQAFYFYDDSVDCSVDVERGKRVKVTFEIDDDDLGTGERPF